MSLLAFAACSVWGACGSDAHRILPSADLRSTSASRSRTGVSAQTGDYLKNDGDDNKNPDDIPPSRGGPGDDDAPLFATYGRSASGKERHAIEKVIRRYYKAATEADGLNGCSLLASGLATELANRQSQSSDAGRRACASVLRRLFQQHHGQLLSNEIATMTITDVHVRGSISLVGLGFRAVPQSEILLQREGHAWKMNALFDSELP